MNDIHIKISDTGGTVKIKQAPPPNDDVYLRTLRRSNQHGPFILRSINKVSKLQEKAKSHW